ncbi:Rgp1-domain-containing protein [Venturia nashicola]|nr:Rgp1-domain-containing protein [Venturia nashicola]
MSRNTAPSNIRVSVQFTKSTVFSGEDVECTITFKNVAREHNETSPARSPQNNGLPSQRKVTPLQNTNRPPPASRNSPYGPSIPTHLKKGHKATLSAATSRQSSATLQDGRATESSVAALPKQNHGPLSPTQSSVQPSPRIGYSPVIPAETSKPTRPSRPLSMRATTNGTKQALRVSPGTLQQNFRFPATDPEVTITSPGNPESAISPTTRLPFRNPSPRPQDSESTLNPIARLISESSANGTSRSSLDLMSNNSDETLASEYVPQLQSRYLQPRPSHLRNGSRLGVREPPRGPETIMMGYAQVMGSFTLDGSLVNQAPFEEVKRKGVVGGHGGGGVVGVERTKRESGLFGALGWNSIGESLGGILGTGELSSIKEMRGIAGSKSIPLVTTPHSILFVDLRLAPGESKSYTYSFALPRGLPPSHKGRAMKVSYHLTIGTQRAGKEKDQQIRSIDVPFRVFGSVTPRGEILGHDLMSPYILLRDLAKTSLISSPNSRPKKPPDTKASTEFMDYINLLLDEQTQSNSGLLSPTSPRAGTGSSRRPSSVAEEPRTMKESIDLAILRSNQRTSEGGKGMSNRFDIARSGLKVATLHFPRPSYRLGETIHLVIDFREAKIPTYAVQVVLETSENVDETIAMRSAGSIYRYTRKVHADMAENALFAQRLAFSLLVPANATPEFITSGVSVEWRVRVEFVTPRVTSERVDEGFEELLEEVSRDEKRGITFQGVEGLKVETFQVEVPVRVYGAVVGGKGEWDIEGLAV